MSSMGYIMMNWSLELARQAKCFRKCKNLEVMKRGRETHESKKEAEDNVGAEERRKSAEQEAALEKHMSRAAMLQSELDLVHAEQEEIRKRLDVYKSTLSASAQRENKLRSQNESLQLEEAQARFELKELKKTVNEELDRREKEHEQQIQLLEQVMANKNTECLKEHEALQNEFNNAMRHTLEQKNIEDMTKQQLEQELSSLAMVLEIRSEELKEERRKSEKLVQRCERLYYFETELGKARQRVEEMNLVVQNKMIAEKELLDISEALTNDLSTSRQEVLSLRRQIENRQYLHMHTDGAVSASPVIVTQQQPCCTSISDYFSSTEDSGSPSLESSQQRNQHQKASSGKPDPSLMLGIVEKQDSVAWMLHMPHSPKTISKWNKQNW